MNKWTNVVIHHSASSFGCARLIQKWHLQRGFSDVGYHLIVNNGRPYSYWKDPIIPMIGSIEMGRPFNGDQWVQKNEIGSHVLGFNATSIGICLIHSALPKDEPYNRFHGRQITKLFELSYWLSDYFRIPYARFYGHYEKDTKKPDCPGFNMDLFRAALTGPEGKKEFTRYMLLNDKIIREKI